MLLIHKHSINYFSVLAFRIINIVHFAQCSAIHIFHNEKRCLRKEEKKNSKHTHTAIHSAHIVMSLSFSFRFLPIEKSLWSLTSLLYIIFLYTCCFTVENIKFVPLKLYGYRFRVSLQQKHVLLTVQIFETLTTIR